MDFGEYLRKNKISRKEMSKKAGLARITIQKAALNRGIGLRSAKILCNHIPEGLKIIVSDYVYSRCPKGRILPGQSIKQQILSKKLKLLPTDKTKKYGKRKPQFPGYVIKHGLQEWWTKHKEQEKKLMAVYTKKKLERQRKQEEKKQQQQQQQHV